MAKLLNHGMFHMAKCTPKLFLCSAAVMYMQRLGGGGEGKLGREKEDRKRSGKKEGRTHTEQ
ncbi:hypothetical protein PP707_00500 [Acetobacter pasteurianus]|nr:hypothetical protein [Acetobacter pasteurianus]